MYTRSEKQSLLFSLGSVILDVLTVTHLESRSLHQVSFVTKTEVQAREKQLCNIQKKSKR